MSRMNKMITFFQTIIPKSPSSPLGRWGIVYSPDKIGEKIDRSNEDHCYCNEYAKKKRVELEKDELEKKRNLKNNEELKE